MKLVRYPVRLLCAMAMLGFIAIPALAAEEEAHVLILNGLDPYFPAYVVTDSAMRAELANETARRIVLYSETLDYRFPVESWEAELVALLTKKYSARHVDVVVAVTKPALAFFSRYGEQLWPGARVVFHGVPDPAVEAIPIPPGAVGVVGRDDLGGTIDIARRLQPTARRILFIGGPSIGNLEVESAGAPGSADRGSNNRNGICIRSAPARIASTGRGGARGFDHHLSHAIP